MHWIPKHFSLTCASMVTSIFSAGNTYTYCATRSLYGLALEGRAPKVLRYCTKAGVPLFCFFIVMVFPCLAFLQVSSASNNVLTWLTSLITAGGIINYIVMTITYIFFYNAMKAQGVDRNTLPYTGWFQPYSVSSCTRRNECESFANDLQAYIGLAWMSILVCVRILANLSIEIKFNANSSIGVRLRFIHPMEHRRLLHQLRKSCPRITINTSATNLRLDHVAPRARSLHWLESNQAYKLRSPVQSRSYLGASDCRRLRGYLHRSSSWLLDRACPDGRHQEAKGRQ